MLQSFDSVLRVKPIADIIVATHDESFLEKERVPEGKRHFCTIYSLAKDNTESYCCEPQ